MDEEISNEILRAFIRDQVDEQGRGLHAKEIRADHEIPEMTTESHSIGQESQVAYGMDVILEAQAGKMLLNNSNDCEEIFRAIPSDPFQCGRDQNQRSSLLY